ncbi:MAG TPA: prolyl oligopeptidase family serine peptidase [Ktedonobacteraceae bacterium]|nr:prolyl oligopeptidase family serine peptidase [Ktedonobacteraceae bacterium]
MRQPVARVDVVRDTYFGTTIEDPYRWMEDWKGEEFQAWVKEQAAYTRAYLDALPGRDSLLAQITELTNAGPVLSYFQVTSGYTFYLRRDPGENLAKLMARTPDGQEKALFDPNRIAGEAQTAIDWYFPSWDGRYVAYGISQGGTENSVLHVLETESGAALAETIPHTEFTHISWLEDNRSFAYHRFPERPANAPPTQRFQEGCTYLHRLGDNPASDQPIFGPNVSKGVEIGPDDYPFLMLSPISDWAIGLIVHGDLNEYSIYAAPRSTLSDPASTPWRKIVDIEDAVVGYALSGDTIYLRTHRDAPRYKVIATSLRQPDLAHATLVAPESQAVIEDIKVAGNYLLLNDLDAGIGRLRRVKRDGVEPEAFTVPFEGSISEWASAPGSSEVLVSMSSWVVSPRLYRCDVNTGSMEDTKLYPPSPIDFSDIETHEVQYPGQDGTPIPLSLIHKKGLKLDGSNPTLLRGYGSYGLNSDAFFIPRMRAWYDLGGVLAVAHMRGGGEYGNEWHMAGKGIHKHNTIEDFIAAAEYLIAQKYTSPERLAGEGGSAGGIPTGGALVRRPDLWSVMVMKVPLVNALRAEFTENGPPNVPEFGSVSSEEGFQGLQIMDAYIRVRDGVVYPAVFLTAGANDPRVVVWQAAKMAARLQVATSSGKPVLLRVEFKGGHGMGSTQQQLNEEAADEFAFFCQQMGINYEGFRV